MESLDKWHKYITLFGYQNLEAVDFGGHERSLITSLMTIDCPV
jgi:hypothetical protein